MISSLVLRRCFTSNIFQHSRSINVTAISSRHSITTNCLLETHSSRCNKIKTSHNTERRTFSTGRPFSVEMSSLSNVVADPAFVDMGLGDSWWPTSLVQMVLENVHLQTGAPWWLTIIVGTVIIRAATLPIHVASRKQMMILSANKEETQRLQNELNRAKLNQHKNMHHEQIARMKLSQHFKEKGISPIKSAGFGAFQPILFMSWFRSIRAMCAVPVPSLIAGGTLWFSNLTIPDHSLILPFVCASIVALSLSQTIGQAFDNEKLNTAIFCLPLICPILALTPIFSSITSAVYLYVGTNALMTLMMVQSLKNKKVKEILNLPEEPKVSAMTTGNTTNKDSKKNSYLSTIKGLYAETKERSKSRREVSVAQNTLKDLRKNQAARLKKPPPTTYEIGTEAILRSSAPDFEVDRRPPKPNIFRKKS